MSQNSQTDEEHPLDVMVEPHPVTGEIQVVICLGSGVRARLAISGASKLQQRLGMAIDLAKQGNVGKIVAVDLENGKMEF